MRRRLFFDATIRLSGIDRIGLLLEVTQILSSQLNVNIHKVLITCDEGLFNGTLELSVHDRKDVQSITDSLKDIEGIKEIIRIM